MTSWQRRARLVAGVVAISVAGGAYWVTGSRRTAAPPPPVTPLEPTVTAADDAAARPRRSSGAREDFALDFKEQKTYTDGRTVATGLTVRVANRGGTSFVVTGKEGTVGAAAGVGRDDRRRACSRPPTGWSPRPRAPPTPTAKASSARPGR